jgi:hypothetical protein
MKSNLSMGKIKLASFHMESLGLAVTETVRPSHDTVYDPPQTWVNQGL